MPDCACGIASRLAVHTLLVFRFWSFHSEEVLHNHLRNSFSFWEKEDLKKCHPPSLPLQAFELNTIFVFKE